MPEQFTCRQPNPDAVGQILTPSDEHRYCLIFPDAVCRLLIIISQMIDSALGLMCAPVLLFRDNIGDAEKTNTVGIP